MAAFVAYVFAFGGLNAHSTENASERPEINCGSLARVIITEPFIFFIALIHSFQIGLTSLCK